jgi:septal ring-binding cell division protein DamX
VDVVLGPGRPWTIQSLWYFRPVLAQGRCPNRLYRTGLATVAVGAMLVAAPVASADHDPSHVSEDNPGIAQYVEQLPTSKGSRAGGVAKPGTRRLRPSVQRRIQREGGSDAPALRELVTSPVLGAPQQPATPTDKPAPTRSDSAGSGSEAAEPASRVSSSSSDAWLAALVVVVFGLTVAMLAARYGRRWVSRDRSIPSGGP